MENARKVQIIPPGNKISWLERTINLHEKHLEQTGHPELRDIMREELRIYREMLGDILELEEIRKKSQQKEEKSEGKENVKIKSNNRTN